MEGRERLRENREWQTAINITVISDSSLKLGYINCLENEMDGPFVVYLTALRQLPGKEHKPLSLGTGVGACMWANTKLKKRNLL